MTGDRAVDDGRGELFVIYACGDEVWLGLVSTKEQGQGVG
jgi:hypothetical protein